MGSFYLFPTILNENTTSSKGLSTGKSKKSNRKADIEINFCLLNDLGEPSNKFKEGENFTFSLLLQNNSDDTLYLDNSFLEVGTNFCSIYTEENKLVGQPFAYCGAVIVSSDTHPFYGKNNVYKLLIPWTDTRKQWNTLHYSFKSTQQGSLPKGKYYTLFNHRFCFDRRLGEPSLCLPPVTKKIEFEVI